MKKNNLVKILSLVLIFILVLIPVTNSSAAKLSGGQYNAVYAFGVPTCPALYHSPGETLTFNVVMWSGNCTAKVQYSLNGGYSWTNVYQSSSSFNWTDYSNRAAIYRIAIYPNFANTCTGYASIAD